MNYRIDVTPDVSRFSNRKRNKKRHLMGFRISRSEIPTFRRKNF